MKAHILDNEALHSISPAAIAAFARGEGWANVEPYGAHADVYEGKGEPEIILPRTDRIGDYAAVVSKLIGVFSQVVERDEFATYKDLICADRDIVRVRAIGSDDDGAVSLDVSAITVFDGFVSPLFDGLPLPASRYLYRVGKWEAEWL